MDTLARGIQSISKSGDMRLRSRITQPETRYSDLTRNFQAPHPRHFMWYAEIHKVTCASCEAVQAFTVRRAFYFGAWSKMARMNVRKSPSEGQNRQIRLFKRLNHPAHSTASGFSQTTSLPVAGLIRSRVSSHSRSAHGRAEGFRARAVRSYASRRMEFAQPSRSGRFWGRAGRRTWRSSP